MILACTLESQRQWPSDGTFNHVETVHLKECFEMKRELLTFQWISPKRICCVRKSIPKPRWGCIAWWKSPKRGSAVAVFGSCSGWAFFFVQQHAGDLGGSQKSWDCWLSWFPLFFSPESWWKGRAKPQGIGVFKKDLALQHFKGKLFWVSNLENLPGKRSMDMRPSLTRLGFCSLFWPICFARCRIWANNKHG